jgi:hypothetical protein
LRELPASNWRIDVLLASRREPKITNRANVGLRTIFSRMQHSLPAGFMKIDYTPGYEGERKTSRLLDFAETLFNLQQIEGFDDPVD